MVHGSCSSRIYSCSRLSPYRIAVAVVVGLLLSANAHAVTMEYQAGKPQGGGNVTAGSISGAMEAACDSWESSSSNLEFCTPVRHKPDDYSWSYNYGFSPNDDRYGEDWFGGKTCSGQFDAEQSEWAVNDPNCDAESICETLTSADNFWGAPLDDWRSGPDYVTHDGCEYAVNRFHTLVDGTALPEYTPTGQEIDGPDDAGPEGTAPTTDANGDTVEPTQGGGTITQENPANNNGQQCGTMNGERVCVGTTPDQGGCIEGSGDFTCSAPGDDPIVPEVEEDERADITDEAQLIESSTRTNVTISQGTVTTGERGLDEEQPPTSVEPGDESGSGGPGDGDGEFDIPSVCEDDPIICEAAEIIADDSIPTDAQAEADGGLPPEAISDQAFDFSPYPVGIPANATCPDPQTVGMPAALGGGSLSIPWTGLCQFASTLRPLIIAVFWGVTGLLVVRRLT